MLLPDRIVMERKKAKQNIVKGIEIEYKTYSFIQTDPAFVFILTIRCFLVSQEVPICRSFFLNGLSPIFP